ncbi:hypothetical protein MBH78_17240 [Oceanimonas sp. NS1]|nr:hypothetical protein [Oceanimonas sp. NS1]
MIPVAIAPAIEHIGDVLAIGSVTGKDYLKSPACTAPCWETAWPPVPPPCLAARPTPLTPR